MKIENIKIGCLRASETNPRKVFSPEGMDELRASVEAQGILQPLLVRALEDGFEVVAGERRWRAARAAGLKTVPCLVRRLSDVQVLEAQVTENLQRADLSPLEEAGCFQALLDLRDAEGRAVYGSAADVARRVGRSPGFVRGRVALRGLPEVAQAAMVEGQLDLFVAGKLAVLPVEVRAAAAKGVMAAGLSSAAAVEWLEGRYERSLRGVAWDLGDGSLVPGRRCVGCALREGDVCRDVGCFSAHERAEYERWAGTMAGEGREVLSYEDNERFVSREGLAGWACGLVELDCCPGGLLLRPAWRGRKDVGSWRELTRGRGVPVVVARGWDYAAMECVSLALAVVAARENGHEIFAQGEGKRETAARVRREGIERENAEGAARTAVAARVRKIGSRGVGAGDAGWILREWEGLCVEMMGAGLERVLGEVEDTREGVNVWQRAAQVLLAACLLRGDDARARALEVCAGVDGMEGMDGNNGMDEDGGEQ